MGKPLRFLGLSLTGNCNLACGYCYASEQRQATMTTATAIRAVKLAAGEGPFILQFSGGEPLLAFAVLREVAQYVRRQKLPAVMQLQTNATLLSPEMMSYLQEARVGIGISLDGRPAVNDRSRPLPTGEGSTRRILAAVSQLAERGMEVGITCVVTAENVAELEGIVELAYYLGNVRRLGFDLLRHQGRGRLLAPAPAPAVAKGVAAALEAARRLEQYTGKRLLISQVERAEALAKRTTHGFAHCHAMNGEAAFVDPQGHIYACASLIGDETFRLGHVKTGINRQRQQAVTSFIYGSMAFCWTCGWFSRCGGACFARWHGSGQYEPGNMAECALKQTCIKWFQAQGR